MAQKRRYRFVSIFAKETLWIREINPRSLAPLRVDAFQIRRRILVGSSEKALSRIYKNAIEFV